MSFVHLRVVHDAHHGFQAPLGNVEDPAHVVLHVVARDGMRRERCGRSRNRGMHCVSVYSGNVSHGFDSLLLERKGSLLLLPVDGLDPNTPSQDATKVSTLPHSIALTQLL